MGSLKFPKNGTGAESEAGRLHAPASILCEDDQQNRWENRKISVLQGPSSCNFLAIVPQSSRKNREEISKNRPGSCNFVEIAPQSNRKTADLPVNFPGPQNLASPCL